MKIIWIIDYLEIVELQKDMLNCVGNILRSKYMAIFGVTDGASRKHFKSDCKAAP